MKRITVLIVDDSAFIRKMYTDILSSEPDIHVLDTAANPLEAREKIKALNPDVLTLDIEMPKMNGLAFLEKIMTLRPMPVIMASSLTSKGAEETIRALEIGAVDIICKPEHYHSRDAIDALKHELISKVRAAASINTARRAAQKREVHPGIIPFRGTSSHMIAIGASTGGVEALRDIFRRLPENSPPIVVTQHMPEHFTRSFAARLNSVSQVEVSEAVNNARLQTGHAYLAPGNRHLRIVSVSGGWVCRLEDGPAVSGHKPSVDMLFHSVAQAAGPRAVGVILTGMGRDGAGGMKAMRECGSYNIGQNQASCVVYGMPQMATKAGAVHVELPLDSIPEAMLKHCEKARIAS
ncbi:MAG: chemotaxis response regulator protein-glutamate methylesterase [Alphaproteobacteria bacterium]|nr:chemotaxis response regulator protein-glutamate methylesterase [Alphaproteobacteria bacterium]